ncbi:MAG: DUF3891 family protein [Christiangramia sp.]
MIVNQVNEGWEIFSHSSHGLLAGKIANEIEDQYKCNNWAATLTAIIEHDDRQLHFSEKNYLTDLGTPRDFLLEKRKVGEITERSNRLLRQAEDKSIWVAMLIIHHLQFIYKDVAKEKKTLATYLDTLESKKRTYMKCYGLTQTDVQKMYQLMVFADRCSLILCQNAIPAMQRSLEINHSINNKTYWIREKENGTVQIDPWIFKNEQFSVTAEYKLLAQPSFGSNKEFESLLNKSDVKIREWVIAK